jgi:hypothetical protein
MKPISFDPGSPRVESHSIVEPEARGRMLEGIRRRFDAAVTRRIDATLARYDVAARRERENFEERLGGLQADYDFLRSEFDRLAPQLAALEYRIERLPASSAANDAGLTSAAAEHERSRIRLELVAHYEERIRRLEES